MKLAFLNGQNWELALPGGETLPSLASNSGIVVAQNIGRASALRFQVELSKLMYGLLQEWLLHFFLVFLT